MALALLLEKHIFKLLKESELKNMDCETNKMHQEFSHDGKKNILGETAIFQK